MTKGNSCSYLADKGPHDPLTIQGTNASLYVKIETLSPLNLLGNICKNCGCIYLNDGNFEEEGNEKGKQAS